MGRTALTDLVMVGGDGSVGGGMSWAGFGRWWQVQQARLRHRAGRWKQMLSRQDDGRAQSITLRGVNERRRLPVASRRPGTDESFFPFLFLLLFVLPLLLSFFSGLLLRFFISFCSLLFFFLFLFLPPVAFSFKALRSEGGKRTRKGEKRGGGRRRSR